MRGLPFILTESDGAVLTDRVIALVRSDGRTTILADGGQESSAFTPLALARRSARFWRERTWSRTN